METENNVVCYDVVLTCYNQIFFINQVFNGYSTRNILELIHEVNLSYMSRINYNVYILT